MSAQWPTAVVTTSQLYVAVNELQNNLSAGINAAVTTIGLNSATGFPTVGLVLIDNEVVQYTGVSGNNLTGCTRGFDSTTAATHSSGATVSFAFCAAHYNNAANEIIAVETSLAFTASKAMSSDASGRLAVATTTLAELNFLAGVTSAVQTQLNTLTTNVALKAPLAGPTFSGTITTALTASRALVTGASNELAVSAVTSAELAFVSGVTSAIQTQLNAKQATLTAGQLPGTATNDSASAGNVGEYVSADMSSVSFPTSSQWGDLTSIALTAGDWDVHVHGEYANNTATPSFADVGLSTTTGNSSTGLTLGVTYQEVGSGIVTGANVMPLASLTVRFSLSGNATVYVKGRSSYSGGPPQYSGRVSARRMR